MKLPVLSAAFEMVRCKALHAVLTAHACGRRHLIARGYRSKNTRFEASADRGDIGTSSCGTCAVGEGNVGK